MPLIEKPKAFERFKKDAANSSHFVWFLDELQFFESSEDHWIFGFRTIGNVTLVALEPLIPAAPQEYGLEHEQAFERAWKEFSDTVPFQICAFVAVYDGFQKILAQQGFQTLKIGQEPWVDLNDCIPKGNAGKGVRAARNQAIHAGVTVEEWSAQEILAEPAKRETIAELFRTWKTKRILNLGGFLNATDPFAYADSRRYFVAKSKDGEVEGYLIATPVAGIQGYFLEDLVLRPKSTRGSGELLTLEALVRLGESGHRVASLGVVSVTSIDAKCSHGLPRAMELILIKLPQALQKLYNFNGLETFRKRFKPQKWENIHFAVKTRPDAEISDSRAWIFSLLTLARAFRPRIRITFNHLFNLLASPFRKHPVSTSIAMVSLLCFHFINHWGALPHWALDQYGFSAEAPGLQWLYRTLTSDFLYTDPLHFWSCFGLLFALVRWAEDTHNLRFVWSFFLALSFFDDLINYALLIYPFAFLRPILYDHLIQFKDVGGSLVLMAFLGLQLCQFRKRREIIFASMALVCVLGYLFKTAHLGTFVLELDHFVFLVSGYIVGKLKFEHEKKTHQNASRNKPPVSKTVATSHSHAKAESKGRQKVA